MYLNLASGCSPTDFPPSVGVAVKSIRSQNHLSLMPSAAILPSNLYLGACTWRTLCLATKALTVFLATAWPSARRAARSLLADGAFSSSNFR